MKYRNFVNVGDKTQVQKKFKFKFILNKDERVSFSLYQKPTGLKEVDYILHELHNQDNKPKKNVQLQGNEWLEHV